MVVLVQRSFPVFGPTSVFTFDPPFEGFVHAVVIPLGFVRNDEWDQEPGQLFVIDEPGSIALELVEFERVLALEHLLRPDRPDPLEFPGWVDSGYAYRHRSATLAYSIDTNLERFPSRSSLVACVMWGIHSSYDSTSARSSQTLSGGASISISVRISRISANMGINVIPILVQYSSRIIPKVKK